MVGLGCTSTSTGIRITESGDCSASESMINQTTMAFSQAPVTPPVTGRAAWLG
jgi:hypothetical protein